MFGLLFNVVTDPGEVGLHVGAGFSGSGLKLIVLEVSWEDGARWEWRCWAARENHSPLWRRPLAAGAVGCCVAVCGNGSGVGGSSLVEDTVVLCICLIWLGQVGVDAVGLC